MLSYLQFKWEHPRALKEQVPERVLQEDESPVAVFSNAEQAIASLPKFRLKKRARA